MGTRPRHSARAASRRACPQRIDGPAADATQFDSEALWQQVHPQVGPGDRVLIVRGRSRPAARKPGHGRDWLARQIAAAGGHVDFVVAYERGAPQLSADAFGAGPPGGPRRLPLAARAAPKPSPTWSSRCRSTTGAPPAHWPPTRVLRRQPTTPALAGA